MRKIFLLFCPRHTSGAERVVICFSASWWSSVPLTAPPVLSPSYYHLTRIKRKTEMKAP